MDTRLHDLRRLRRARLGRALVAGLVAVAAVAVAVAALLLTLRSLRPAEKETVDRYVVVEAVRKILKVATIETQIAEVVTYRDVKPVLYFFSSEKNAIIRVRGKVLAGFDLTSKRLDIRIDEATRKVVVRLPHASVLTIDPTIEILDETSGWRNPVTLEDRNLWLRWARGDLRRGALDSGILARAETNARELLGTIAGSWGYELEVSFDGAGEPEPTEEPDSVPLVPRG